MPLTTLPLVLALQWLQPDPRVGEVGRETVVRARDAQGRPLAGLAVRQRRPDGATRGLGTTGPEGRVRFRPEQAGRHELRARMPGGGPVLLVSYHVARPPPRWPYAVVLVPAGLLLLWWNLARWRRLRRAGPARAPTGGGGLRR